MSVIRTVIIYAVMALVCAVRHAAAAELVVQTVGDIMLAGPWEQQVARNNYHYSFERIAPELRAGDINLANLEFPLSRGGREFTTKKFRFRGNPAIATTLRAVGFNAVTLANNHIMDFGLPALTDTIHYLDQAGIAHVGAGATLEQARRPVILSSNGIKIALLGYSLTQPLEFFATDTQGGTAPGWKKFVHDDISRIRRQVDYVMVSFHWGKEASGRVQPYQQQAAHTAIDAGADAVIGHHPHVLQGVERYRQGIIFYSLGNFAFASKSTTAEISAMIRFRLDGHRRSAEIIPLDVLYRRVMFQPRRVSGRQATQVIDTLNRLSEPFATSITRQPDGRYLIPF